MRGKEPVDKDSLIPAGWDYNPAAWDQRLPVIVLASIGFVIAMYLSLYQWDVIPEVWEPFFSSHGFDGQSRKILRESGVAKESLEILKVPDAFLGALGYLADAITGAIGGRNRWRTLPWIVIVFGVFVGPLGAVSIALVIVQPVLYKAWCTLCLVTAVISVLMIGPAMDEVLASMQHVRREMLAGRSIWKALRGS